MPMPPTDCGISKQKPLEQLSLIGPHPVAHGIVAYCCQCKGAISDKGWANICIACWHPKCGTCTTAPPTTALQEPPMQPSSTGPRLMAMAVAGLCYECKWPIIKPAPVRCVNCPHIICTVRNKW